MATTHSLAMYQLIAMTRQEAHQPPAVPFTIEQAHRSKVSGFGLALPILPQYPVAQRFRALCSVGCS